MLSYSTNADRVEGSDLHILKSAEASVTVETPDILQKSTEDDRQDNDQGSKSLTRTSLKTATFKEPEAPGNGSSQAPWIGTPRLLRERPPSAFTFQSLALKMGANWSCAGGASRLFVLFAKGLGRAGSWDSVSPRSPLVKRVVCLCSD